MLNKYSVWMALSGLHCRYHWSGQFLSWETCNIYFFHKSNKVKLIQDRYHHLLYASFIVDEYVNRISGMQVRINIRNVFPFFGVSHTLLHLFVIFLSYFFSLHEDRLCDHIFRTKSGNTIKLSKATSFNVEQ